MKRFVYLFLLITCCFLFVDNAYAYEKVDNSLKIYDYGEYLTEDAEKEIKSKIDEYTKKYNLDMVIVTKKDYSGNIQRYGQDFYDYNGFGVGNTHDGILLVYNVDSEGPYAEIVTTGEGIRMYDDNRIDSILSAMSRAKPNGDAAMIKAFVKETEEYASLGIPSSNQNTYVDKNGDLQYKRKYPILGISIISVITSSVIIGFLIAKNKMVNKATNAEAYLVKNSININERNDRFVNTYTSRTRIHSESSGSSSGSSGRVGGSSISHGSSGTSHGGGGRRL